MAYDTKLADRVRRVLARRRGIEEKRMFGGLSFLSRGHMFCGIVGDELMARVGPEQYAKALGRKHVRKMDFTGRPLKGYVYVGSRGLSSAKALTSWVELGLKYARTLPAR